MRARYRAQYVEGDMAAGPHHVSAERLAGDGCLRLVLVRHGLVNMIGRELAQQHAVLALLCGRVACLRTLVCRCGRGRGLGLVESAPDDARLTARHFVGDQPVHAHLLDQHAQQLRLLLLLQRLR